MKNPFSNPQQQNEVLDRIFHRLNVKNELINATIDTPADGQLVKLEVLRFKRRTILSTFHQQAN